MQIIWSFDKKSMIKKREKHKLNQDETWGEDDSKCEFLMQMMMLPGCTGVPAGGLPGGRGQHQAAALRAGGARSRGQRTALNIWF